MCGYDTTNSLRGQGLEFVKVAVCAILPQQKPLPAALWQQRGGSFCVLWRAAGRASCPGGGRQQGSIGAAPQHVPKQCGGRPRTSPRIGTLSFVTQSSFVLVRSTTEGQVVSFPFLLSHRMGCAFQAVSSHPSRHPIIKYSMVRCIGYK